MTHPRRLLNLAAFALTLLGTFVAANSVAMWIEGTMK